MSKDITEKINERLRLSELIACKRIGIISQEEKIELDEILKKESCLNELYKQLMAQTDRPETTKTSSPDKETNHYWKQFQKKYIPKDAKPQQSPRYISFLKYIACSAAAVAAIVCGILLSINPSLSETKENPISSTPIKCAVGNDYALYNPVVYKAIHNHSPIENYQLFSPFNKVNNNLLTSKATQNGSNINVITSDSSRIILSQCSTLNYLTKFDSQVREVWLKGEAYFHVRHEEKRRFLVHVGDVTISVLGTQFNISAYPNAPTKITLISGSIKVETPKEELPVQPGETVTYSNEKLTVRKENCEEVTAWTNNRFYFNHRTMKELSEILSTWYGIDIKCQDERTEQAIVFLDIDRQFSMFYILQNIESLHNDQVICFKSINKKSITAYIVDRP